jgi:anti-sigma regulatory factor (Ser/Thr protein kinase)
VSFPVGADESEAVKLSFPGSIDLVVLARFTAAAVGSRAGFDIDEIEDLRLAIDELCISFGPVEQFGNVNFEFLRIDDQVRIAAVFEQPTNENLEHRVADSTTITNWERTSELSMLLLDALVDNHGKEELDGRRFAWMEKRSGSDR